MTAVTDGHRADPTDPATRSTHDPVVAWLADNQRWLLARVAELRRRLDGRVDPTTEPVEANDASSGSVRAGMAHPPALERLAGLLDLSDFEVELLVLLAGTELDPDLAPLVGHLRGHAHAAAATPGLAMDVLDGAYWGAFAPGAPLRRLRMVVVTPDGAALASAELRLDERVLHHLLGVDDPDERLGPFLSPVMETGATVASHERVADRVAATWAPDGVTAGVRAPIQVWGPHRDDRRQVLAAAATRLGHPARRLSADDLPANPTERDGLHRLLVREWVLRPSLLVAEVDDRTGDGATRRAVALATAVPGALLSSRHPIDTETPTVDLAVAAATTAERWTLLALFVDASPDAPVPPAAAQFALGTARLAAAGQAAARDERAAGTALWAACRAQARAHLDGLAQRIDPVATWDDLVVPKAIEATLRGIRDHVMHRSRVLDDWGWKRRGTRGLGVTALFSGASGTGKTMAAEVLANDLDLDLYRIDLSAVVSKYIGETEKNLARLFDAAEAGGAILLFDEADALFGKRTEVKDSHDRYANIEVSYLLQRMEAYRGLAILTTNVRDAIDDAFLRRIRFVVRFPFPDHDDRVRLWRGIWPDEVPLADLDLDRLARLGLPGGNIRSIALDASFRAAVASNGAVARVDMDTIAAAVRAEARKTEHPLRAEDWGETP